MLKTTKNIAIFASGAGSNAAKIIAYFASKKNIAVKLVMTNKPSAGVVDIAHKNTIPTLIIEKERFFQGDAYVVNLKEAAIDFIVLAGFLWKVPMTLINAYPNEIINIHPALLPKYGGKGMYGMHVHEAIVNNHETESGITVHFVDGQYDHGDIIFQAKCDISSTDTAADVAKKIHHLEYAHFAEVIEQVIDRSSQ